MSKHGSRSSSSVHNVQQLPSGVRKSTFTNPENAQQAAHHVCVNRNTSFMNHHLLVIMDSSSSRTSSNHSISSQMPRNLSASQGPHAVHNSNKAKNMDIDSDQYQQQPAATCHGGGVDHQAVDDDGFPQVHKRDQVHKNSQHCANHGSNHQSIPSSPLISQSIQPASHSLSSSPVCRHSVSSSSTSSTRRSPFNLDQFKMAAKAGHQHNKPLTAYLIYGLVYSLISIQISIIFSPLQVCHAVAPQEEYFNSLPSRSDPNFRSESSLASHRDNNEDFSFQDFSGESSSSAADQDQVQSSPHSSKTIPADDQDLQHFTNEFAVHIPGGCQADADRLAARYGFTNKGQVSVTQVKDLHRLCVAWLITIKTDPVSLFFLFYDLIIRSDHLRGTFHLLTTSLPNVPPTIRTTITHCSNLILR